MVLRVIVETEGAVYALDLAAMTLRRYPRDEVVVVEDSPHLLPAAVAALRRDGESIPFNFLVPLEIGKPAQFLLQIRDDGVQTIRTTTDVLNIVVTED
jgi:hypothetical protein